jgi:hypothetical protein
MSVWSVQPIDSMGISIDWFPLIVPAVAKIAKLVYSSNNYGLWVHDNPITSNYYSIWRAMCFCFLFFFAAGFDFLGGFLVLCFPVSLLFCSLLLCFHCFSAFPASLLFLLLCLFWFSAVSFPCFCAFLLGASLLFPLIVFPASLLFCFCALLLLLFYCFFQSCVSASLLPGPLPPCFLSLLSLCFSCSVALYPKGNPRQTLGETQRNPKEILAGNPGKKPYVKP